MKIKMDSLSRLPLTKKGDKMKSRVLNLYTKWLATATPKEIEFVDSVYAECEKHYSAGGDWIVECFTPEEILEQFDSLDTVRKFCGWKIEQELNARWGEDSDPQLERSRRFAQWKEKGNQV